MSLVKTSALQQTPVTSSLSVIDEIPEPSCEGFSRSHAEENFFIFMYNSVSYDTTPKKKINIRETTTAIKKSDATYTQV